jgi:hypothetical protein
MSEKSMAEMLDFFASRKCRFESYHPCGFTDVNMSTDIHIRAGKFDVYVRAPNGVRCVSAGSGATLNEALKQAYDGCLENEKTTDGYGVYIKPVSHECEAFALKADAPITEYIRDFKAEGVSDMTRNFHTEYKKVRHEQPH